MCLLWPQLSDPSDLPKNAFSIFLLLVEHLCVDHIDYALEIGLSGKSRRQQTEDKSAARRSEQLDSTSWFSGLGYSVGLLV